MEDLGTGETTTQYMDCDWMPRKAKCEAITYWLASEACFLKEAVLRGYIKGVVTDHGCVNALSFI